jgi:cell shape-determining protein MreC
LPREADVVIGDKILSSDINRVLVGVVKDVEMEATDSFKKVLVISAANIYTENFVTVLP